MIDSSQSGIEYFETAPVYNLDYNTSNLSIIKILSYPFLVQNMIKRIKKVLHNEQPDIIHLHWMHGLHAYALTHLGFKNVISTPWGSDLLIKSKKPLERLVLRKIVLGLNRIM